MIEGPLEREGLTNEPSAHSDRLICMREEKEKLKLEGQLARYRELAREFPAGPTNATIQDMIEELEQRLRNLEG